MVTYRSMLEIEHQLLGVRP